MIPFKDSLKPLYPALKALILVFSIGFGWFLLKNTNLGTVIQDYEWIRLKISESAIWGPLIFILLGGFATALGFPRIALCSIAGFVAGFLKGSFFGIMGTITGCILTYYWAHYLGRDLVEKKLSSRIKKYEPYLKNNTFIITLTIRLFPIGNNLLTNLLAGVSSVKPLPYFLASFIGYVPQTLIFSLIGSGIRKDLWFRSITSLLLYIISGFLIIFLTKKIRKEFNTAA